jgi:hypothetical protein
MSATAPASWAREGSALRATVRRNGLSLVTGALFLLLLVAQVLTGAREYNNEQLAHGGRTLDLMAYLTTGHFMEATAENWESEFLQMAAYVVFTVFLYQRGSSESKNPGGKEAVDRDPRNARGRKLGEAPSPVRRGGWVLRLYENSLSLAFVALFLASFAMHASGGARAHNEELLAHGEAPVTVFEYVRTARFWFESFQNWQSEFLALVAMVVLSIYLRQRGSPESKPVDAPNSHTGSS